MKFEIFMTKFVGAGKKAEISDIIGWFCLKHKLLEQNTDTTVPSPDTEGLWKVSAKSELWFPIQPTQKWQIFLEQVRPKFQI